MITYKADQVITDEIRVGISCNGLKVIVNEELDGWEKFVNMIKTIFPEIPYNWE